MYKCTALIIYKSLLFCSRVCCTIPVSFSARTAQSISLRRISELYDKCMCTPKHDIGYSDTRPRHKIWLAILNHTADCRVPLRLNNSNVCHVTNKNNRFDCLSWRLAVLTVSCLGSLRLTLWNRFSHICRLRKLLIVAVKQPVPEILWFFKNLKRCFKQPNWRKEAKCADTMSSCEFKLLQIVTLCRCYCWVQWDAEVIEHKLCEHE